MEGPFSSLPVLEVGDLLRYGFLVLSAVPVATFLLGLYALITASSHQDADRGVRTVCWGAAGVVAVLATYALTRALMLAR